MSEPQRSVTDPSAFKHGSLGKQALLAAVTFGLYALYWWHQTHEQLAAGTDTDFDPTMRTVGLFVPFYGLYIIWQDCNDLEAVTDQSAGVLFALFLFLAPAAWFMVQSGINDAAAGS